MAGHVPGRLLKKSPVDAMQGENRLESGAYTAVREHFEAVFNVEASPEAFRQPASPAGIDLTA
jgi:hypothetical protein